MILGLHSQQTSSQVKYHTNPWLLTSSETWHTSSTAVITNMTVHLILVTPLEFIHLILAAPLKNTPNICNIIRERLSTQVSGTLNRDITLKMLFSQPMLSGFSDSLCYVLSLSIEGGALQT